MTDQERRSQLTALFQETVSAHHQAFIETDGDDPEWPLWYATYLQPRLSRLLAISCTKSQLVYLLLSAEHHHQREASSEHWTVYYAEFILKHYQPSVSEMQGQPCRARITFERRLDAP